jgi:phosphopantothenoylcysteine decarboxylase/phosphopantothenate--cysteine ligase
MGGDRNTVHLLSRNGDTIDVESWPVMTKEQVAIELIAHLVKNLLAKSLRAENTESNSVETTA